jgi:hypothetical protein
MTALELETSLHGPYVIILTPSAETRQRVSDLGRDPDSFRIHGDSIARPGYASQGCIILGHPARFAMWTSLDHELNVLP